MDNYDWRYENSIMSNKQYQETEGITEHNYSSWRTNTVLSNYIDTIMQANEMNINPTLDEKLQYDFLFYTVKSKKRFFKKAKQPKTDVFKLIQEYYKYNDERTKEVLKILTKEQIETIRKKQEKGGLK